MMSNDAMMCDAMMMMMMCVMHVRMNRMKNRMNERERKNVCVMCEKNMYDVREIRGENVH